MQVGKPPVQEAKCCACLLYRMPLSDMFLAMFLADMRLHMYADLCTCMWVGGWRFVYMYVGWGCLQYMYQCLHEETVSMEPHIILQMCLNVRIKFAAVDCLL